MCGTLVYLGFRVQHHNMCFCKVLEEGLGWKRSSINKVKVNEDGAAPWVMGALKGARTGEHQRPDQ